MEFDTISVALLESRPDAPRLSDREIDALQDAHMDHLATLGENGRLQAAGPLVSSAGSSFRGLCLHRLPPEEVRELYERDPYVRAGQLTVRVFAWMVPKGAVAFYPVRFPHSQAEL
jgi:uncharacterized protein YciI